jgi:hypothetical protein
MEDTMTAYKPIKEEVFKAVQDDNFFHEQVRPLTTKQRVVERTAENAGIKIDRQMYRSTSSQARQVISIGEVQRHLETLVKEGMIFALKGDHWLLDASPMRYGKTSKATYYLSKRAVDWLIARHDAKADREATDAAMKAAEEVILKKYMDELQAEFEAQLTAQPKGEGQARWDKEQAKEA